ncbi:cas scaffolding protein family member 4 [Colossoma macropomum]|uniref:cas scaffolding protein family member 4 n=1 Tax=Colossoma macropomum TaxID=42526 RepID=UPI00186443DC|nr:cas scaffolding protein family member 4 [Colossoma macropomum]
METLFAKALYDNTAESPDELAFHKGDIVTVIEQNVEGITGWWKCSLHGKEGLAPANRLMRLSQAEAEALGLRTQNIYQIPKVPQPLAASPTYEIMERIYKVPSMQAAQVTMPFPQKHKTPEVPEGTVSPHRMVRPSASPDSDVYDVPNLARKGSLITTASPRPLVRNISLLQATEIQKRYETMENRKWKQCQNNVYIVPPSIPQEPNYDIPVPSNSEAHQRVACGYSTMPNPRKSEWIYDVPVAPEKSRGEAANSGTIPSKCMNSGKQLYDTLPARVWPATTSASSLYDIPKSSMAAQQSVDSSKPGNEGIYDVPPAAKQKETSLEVLPLQKQQKVNLNDSDKGPVPLEYRGNSGPMYDFPRGRPSWGRKAKMSNQSQEGAISMESEESVEKGRGLSLSENQRSSTASTSSTTSSSSRSSCDSLMLSSPSPELLREITMSQEDVSQKLLDLQEVVCKAIPKLMDFVSSRWRCREHLGQHLQEIRIAAEDVANSVNSFLDFVLDVRGNARRLTDSNLQARLQKQLSIVEDSGLILQESVQDLGGLGWSLDALVQDPEQPHTPDQLERFVMVARTVPEDVKRLVSILNANGKLLFRSSSKEPETSKNASPSDRGTSLGRNETLPDSEGDDNDYVQLQTKTEFEQQQQIKEKDDTKTDTNEGNKGKQVSKPVPPRPPSKSQSPSKSQISDHCRLYFGAIKKAITVFVGSLEEGQPPEKFIAHGKLVIMVGQRLMDSLCSEAQSRPDCQELLCKSNHLCALLKQLAVATKKAALHFPDKVAIQEARDFAKELAQRAHHFRMSLDL